MHVDVRGVWQLSARALPGKQATTAIATATSRVGGVPRMPDPSTAKRPPNKDDSALEAEELLGAMEDRLLDLCLADAPRSGVELVLGSLELDSPLGERLREVLGRRWP